MKAFIRILGAWLLAATLAVGGNVPPSIAPLAAASVAAVAVNGFAAPSAEALPRSVLKAVILSRKAAVSAATHVNSDVYTFTTGNESFAFPTGAAANDIIIAVVQMGFGTGETLTATGSGVALTPIDYDAADAGGTVNSLFWRKLTQADITDGRLTVANGENGVCMMVYRGANAVTRKTRNPVINTTSVSMTGWAPAGNTAGAVFLTVDRDFAATTISGSPGAWTSRLNNTIPNFRCFGQDLLSGITNTTHLWTNFDNTFGVAGFKTSFDLELTQ